MCRRQLGPIRLQQQPGPLAKDRVDIRQVAQQLLERRAVIRPAARQQLFVDIMEQLAQAFLAVLQEKAMIACGPSAPSPRSRGKPYAPREPPHSSGSARKRLRAGYRMWSRRRYRDLVGPQITVLADCWPVRSSISRASRIGSCDRAGGDRLWL